MLEARSESLRFGHWQCLRRCTPANLMLLPCMAVGANAMPACREREVGLALMPAGAGCAELLWPGLATGAPTLPRLAPSIVRTGCMIDPGVRGAILSISVERHLVVLQ